MRLVRLEVEHFRGVCSATVDFAPGVNVLHGPNELGKSTLAEAVRAALLTRPSTVQGDTYLRWDGAVPTRVVLTFAVGGDVWRVTKRFSSPTSALLERQVGASAGKWHRIVEGGGVEGKLRELLHWGMAPPGGKGALSRKESYLVVALLGRQGEVGQILASSLEADQDDTGKLSITKALGALGSDPRVTDIVERLTERIDDVFTPTGRVKQTAESPLFKLQQKVQAEVAALEALRVKEEESRRIAALVVAAQDEWLRAVGQHREADAVLKAAQRRHEHDEVRTRLQVEVDECRAALGQAASLRDRVVALRAELDTAVATEQAARTAATAAVAAADDLSRQVQEASEDVVRAQAARDRTGLEDASERQQQRLVLTAQKAAAQERLRQVEAADAAAARLAQLERDLASALDVVAARKADQARALAALDHATWTAELTSLLDLEQTVLRLRSASDDAERREATAAAELAQAEAGLSAAESYRQRQGWLAEPAVAVAAADLEQLEAAAQALRVDTARARAATLEALDAQRRRHLDAATGKREEASRLEQDAAARELPSAERVAEWRQWQAELEAEAQRVPNAASASAAGSGFTAAVSVALVAVAAGVLVGTAVFLAGGGATASAAAALVAGVLAGALVWSRAATHGRAAASARERRRLLKERLERELQPALRRARVASLAEVEGARQALDEMKTRASRLRSEAAQDDQEAARIAAQVAPLAAEPVAGIGERDTAIPDVLVRQRLEALDHDPAALQARQEAARAHLGTLQATLSQAADVALATARDARDQQKARHAQRVKDAAAAKAQHDEVLRRYDATRVTALRAEIAAAGVSGPSPLSTGGPMALESARAAVDLARDDVSAASATAEGLRRQVAELRSTVAQHLTTLGDDAANAGARVADELAGIDAQLAALERSSSDRSGDAATAVAAAEHRRDEASGQLVAAKSDVERAVAAVSAAAATRADVATKVASTEGALDAIDTVTLEARLATALAHPAFAEPEASGPDVVVATEAFELTAKRLHDCEGRVNEAKGQLRLVGGHTVTERVARQEEVVALARQEYEDRERTERAAQHLLGEIKAAEAEATSNLGRTLAGPVTEMLKELTGGRYGAVEFDTDLTAGGVSASGASRALDSLSVGAREQIATLVRLAIAAQLQTALVLDDQLVHSDTERLQWFRERLAVSARDRQHQIIVITCRPGDYVPAPGGADGDHAVNVVDLATVVDASR